MKRRHLIIAVLFLGIAMIALSMGGPTEDEIEVPPPPDLTLPAPLDLPTPLMSRRDEVIDIHEDQRGILFTNCTLRIFREEGISISGCELVGSTLLIEGSRGVVLSGNRIRDYYVHEDAAVRVQNVEGLLMEGNEVVNNSIGMIVGRGSDIEIRLNLFEANDQHNAVSGLNCYGAEIHHNIFRFNFPHALLIMNREGDPGVHLDIHDNLFDRNLEDAINFEDFRGAEEETRVYGNRINGTGWSGVNVEYNSWHANIVIEDNYIDANGLMTEELLDDDGRPLGVYPSHEHQPEPYSPGWAHGIKLEDCSGVTIRDNVVVHNVECGVDIRNARDVVLEGNIIAYNRLGVSIMGYDEASLHREFSPLSEADAGESRVSGMDNSVSDNPDGDWRVEEGSELSDGG